MIDKEEMKAIKMCDVLFISLDEIYKDGAQEYRMYYKTVKNLIDKLENRIKELEEIEQEHQKLNGELQEKTTKLEAENKRLEEIIDGKAIQEMGMSDLYKED